MSQYGIKAAKTIAKDLPSSGDWLAADLCNAVTPVKIVAAQLKDPDLVKDLQAGVDLVMELVEELRGHPIKRVEHG